MDDHYYIRAFLSDHNDIMSMIIKKGSDVNAKGIFGWTPLHRMSYNDHADIAVILIEDSADVNEKDRWERVALHYTSLNVYIDIISMLIKQGADVNTPKTIVDKHHCAWHL